MTRLSPAERAKAFGPPGQVDKVAVTTPWGIKVTAHRLVVGVFAMACQEAHDTCAWKPQRIDSYAFRKIRGSKADSLHASALAWDFFATGPDVPPPGGVWTPDNAVPPGFAACFTRRGFTWGDVWTRRDVPHIEWAGPPPAGVPVPAQQTVKVKPMFDPPIPVVDMIPWPHGGVVAVGPDGAVYNAGGSPYLGGANGKPYFAGKKAARILYRAAVDGSYGEGYTIQADDGSLYRYDGGGGQ